MINDWFQLPAIDSEHMDLKRKGVSDWSPVVEIKVAGDELAPAAPSISASSASQAIDLTLTKPTTNADGTTCVDFREFRVYHSASSGIDTTNPTTYDGYFYTSSTKHAYPATVKTYFVATAWDRNGNESAPSSEVSATPESTTPTAVDDYTNNIANVYTGDGMIGIEFQPPKSTWVRWAGWKLYYDVNTGTAWGGTWTLAYTGSGPGFLHKGLDTTYAYKYKLTVLGEDGTETAGTVSDNAGAGYTPNATDNSTIAGVTVFAERVVATDEVRTAHLAAGSVTADKISVTSLSAIKADLGAVTAGSIVVGDATNKLWLNDAADGGLAIGGTVKTSAPFRVTAAGALTATSATISGALTTASGSSIDGGYLTASSVTADKISVTNLSSIKADLGTVTAGSIVVGSTNMLWLNDAADGGLAIGGTVKASAPFRVGAAGNLTATSATIQGTVTIGAGSSGIANLSDAYADPRVSNAIAEASTLTIERPGGASFSANTSSLTGAIVITLPQSWTNTMILFEVDVYNYATGKSFTLHLGGYNYSGTPAWINTTANLVGDTSADNRVRFGHDGTKCCVVIGDTTSTWSYPKVTVRNFQAGYSNYAISQWDSGWSIGILSDLTGYTFTSDFADSLIDAAAIKNQGALATLNVVGTAQISDLAVTGAKIANATIGTAKITDLTFDKITAATNTASLTIGSAGNIKSGQTAYNTGTGWYLGNDAGTPKFSIGDGGSSNYLTWDGSTLTVRGNLSVSTITFDAITAGTNTATLTMGSGGYFKSANYSAGSAGFQITGAGDAEFNSVTVRGALIAGSGSSIDGGYLVDLSVGTAKIADLAVTTAKINSLVADKITSGSFSGQTFTGGLFQTASTGYRAEMSDAGYPFRYWDGTTYQFYVDTAGNVYANSLQDVNGQTIVSGGVFQGAKLIGYGYNTSYGEVVGDYRTCTREGCPGTQTIWSSVSKTVPSGKRWVVMASSPARYGVTGDTSRGYWSGMLSNGVSGYFKDGTTYYDDGLPAGSYSSLYFYVSSSSMISADTAANDMWVYGKVFWMILEVPA